MKRRIYLFNDPILDKETYCTPFFKAEGHDMDGNNYEIHFDIYEGAIVHDMENREVQERFEFVFPHQAELELL